MAKPRRLITDARFRYRPSYDTDVRETFRRERSRAGRTAAAERKCAVQPSADVLQLKKRATGGSR